MTETPASLLDGQSNSGANAVAKVAAEGKGSEKEIVLGKYHPKHSHKVFSCFPNSQRL